MAAEQERSPAQLGTLLEERAKLRRDQRGWKIRRVEALDERDKALAAEFSRALGVDVLELAARASQTTDTQLASVRAERDELVKRATDLAARTAAAHRAAVEWGFRHGGLGSMLKRYLHNPSLTSKVCFEWESYTWGDGETFDVFSILDDLGGALPDDYVDVLRPFVNSDVGSSYWGHKFCGVSQTLTYRITAPEASTLVDYVSIVLDAHGVLSAWSGDFFSFFVSRLLAAGGEAALEMSINVCQDLIRPDGSIFETWSEVTSNHTIASCTNRGPTGDDAASVSEVAINGRRLEFPTAIPIVGTSAAAGAPRGGDITVIIEFLTWADADYYHAEAQANFNDPGLGIKVREVILHVP